MSVAMDTENKTAVLIPCHDEATTVGKVIDDFRAQLPDADIYVFDNCCSDETPQIARDHGATVIHEPRKGKGFVVEAMLDRIDADYYIMVDGDDTYPAESVSELLKPVITGRADMAVGARLSDYSDKSFRPLHVFGNKLVKSLINCIFKAELTDILSGYRAFNRRVIRQVPIVSGGFEVETELTVHSLYYRMKIVEVQVPYRDRPEGSQSKLSTFRDGFRVMWKLFNLSRAFKPLTFFGGVGLVLLFLGVLAGIPPIYDYFTDPNHYVHHVPLAILAMGLVMLSIGCGFVGIILHAMNWRFKELHNVMVRGRK